MELIQLHDQTPDYEAPGLPIYQNIPCGRVQLKSRHISLQTAPLHFFHMRESIVEEFVRYKIKKHEVLIFSKSYCSHSTISKNFFHNLDTIYHAVELDKRNDGPEIMRILTEMTGNNHSPHVFVKGEYLGGGVFTEDLKEKADKIKDMLDLPEPPTVTIKPIFEKIDIPLDLPEEYLKCIEKNDLFLRYNPYQ